MNDQSSTGSWSNQHQPKNNESWILAKLAFYEYWKVKIWTDCCALYYDDNFVTSLFKMHNINGASIEPVETPKIT